MTCWCSQFVRSPSRNWLTDLPNLQGIYPCGHCVMCRFVDRSGVFTGSGNKEYQIRHFINCSTTRVLYIMECPCKNVYVGKTKRQLHIGFGEHIKNIKQNETPIAMHFNEYHVGQPIGLKIKGFYALVTSRRGDFNSVKERKVLDL